VQKYFNASIPSLEAYLESFEPVDHDLMDSVSR
jgi:hypothetical protein